MNAITKVEGAPTAADVRVALNYDASTGVLTRKVASSRMKVGDVAGSMHKTGYLTFFIFSTQQLAHRIAWLHFYGEWPLGQIDHIDGNRSNNRIDNLRVVDNKTNGENRRAANRNNAGGALGVRKHRTGRFEARIKTNGRVIYLGLHDSAELACAAYVTAKRKLHAGSTL